VAELQSGAPLPAKVLTANAYLGAAPIRAALDAARRSSSPVAAWTRPSRWAC
jgi:hypothetical protein